MRPNEPAPSAPEASITELLHRSRTGEDAALAALYARLYPEIKRVAHARLADTGGASGLNTTGLVHEGFLRLAERQGLAGETRGQFFAYVGQVLRSVVIDHVRSRQRDKRGGADAVWVTLSSAEAVAAPNGEVMNLLAIDAALKQLRALDAPLAELVDMVSFAGLEPAEVAIVRGVSLRTVQRDLNKARALLAEML